MKKILVMIALAAGVTGCIDVKRVSHEVAAKQKQKCDAIQGRVFYVKSMNSTVSRVDCIVDGAVYRMGDY